MPPAQITMNNYLPIEQLPEGHIFRSLVRTSKRSYQVVLEIQLYKHFTPHFIWNDVAGNGNTPNEAFIMALLLAKRKIAERQKRGTSNG